MWSFGNSSTPILSPARERHVQLRGPRDTPPADYLSSSTSKFIPLLMAANKSLYGPAAYIRAGKDGDVAKQKDIVTNIAKELSLGNLKILGVVTWLGPYVTQVEDLILHGMTVEYFAAIISNLDLSSPIPPARQDVDIIAVWFISRLEQWTIPGLKDSFIALQALIKTGTKAKFTDERAIDGLTAILKKSDVFMDQPKTTRAEAYVYIRILMEKRPELFNQLGDYFIQGILNLGSREKDPKNLLIWFPIMEITLCSTSFAQSNLKAASWEGISKYFPIDYRHGNDTGITAQQLKSALRSCISSSSSFAEYSIPFLMDKLDDQVSASIKEDVIRTLDACVNSYDVETVQIWSSKIFDMLKYEVLNVVDENLAAAGLKVFADIGIRFSRDSPDADIDGNSLMRYVHDVVKDFNSYLMDARQKFVSPAGRILTVVAASSSYAFDMILKEVMPRLITVYSDTQSSEEKVAIMNIIVGLIDAPYAGRDNSSEPRPVSEAERISYQKAGIDFFDQYVKFLHVFKDHFFETFTDVGMNADIDESPLRLVAIRGLLLLARPSNFLSEAEIGTTIVILCNIIMGTTTSKSTINIYKVIDQSEIVGIDVKQAALVALKEISRFQPKIVNTVAIPQLFEVLENSKSGQDDQNSEVAIEAMTMIASQNDHYEEFNLRLVKEFAGALEHQAYYRLILAGLLRAVQLRQESGSDRTRSNDAAEFIKLLRGLCNCAVQINPNWTEKEGINAYLQSKPLPQVSFTDANIPVDSTETLPYDMIGKVIQAVVGWMTFEEQEDIVEETWQLFVPVPDFGEINRHQSMRVRFFASPGLLVLAENFLAGLYPEHKVDWELSRMLYRNMDIFMNSVDLTMEEKSATLSSNYSLDIIALLINKWKRTLEEATWTNPVAYLQDKFTLESVSKSERWRSQVVKLATTIAQAANLRGNAKIATDVMDFLVKLTPTHRAVAQGFELLVKPSQVLAEENHAVIRRISSSRPFGFCIPGLLRLYQEFADTQTSLNTTSNLPQEAEKKKINCAIAIMGLIRHTPSSTVIDSLSEIFPVLMLAVTQKEVDMASQLVAIDTIRLAMAEAPTVVDERIYSVVKALCARFGDAKATSRYTREAAAHALGLIPQSPKLKLHCKSLKRDIMKALDLAASDPSRSVRDKAVKCRSNWFNLLATSTGDDD